jgi:hypothetical protein
MRGLYELHIHGGSRSRVDLVETTRSLQAPHDSRGLAFGGACSDLAMQSCAPQADVRGVQCTE